MTIDTLPPRKLRPMGTYEWLILNAEYKENRNGNGYIALACQMTKAGADVDSAALAAMDKSMSLMTEQVYISSEAAIRWFLKRFCEKVFNMQIAGVPVDALRQALIGRSFMAKIKYEHEMRDDPSSEQVDRIDRASYMAVPSASGPVPAGMPGQPQAAPAAAPAPVQAQAPQPAPMVPAAPMAFPQQT
jgi:hypothetical protein